MPLLADIASGDTGAADVFFLIAAVVAFGAAVLSYWHAQERVLGSAALAAAVGLACVALLLL
jgi:hypothetical protein